MSEFRMIETRKIFKNVKMIECELKDRYNWTWSEELNDKVLRSTLYQDCTLHHADDSLTKNLAVFHFHVIMKDIIILCFQVHEKNESCKILQVEPMGLVHHRIHVKEPYVMDCSLQSETMVCLIRPRFILEHFLDDFEVE